MQDIARSDVEIYTIGLFDEDDSDVNRGALRKIAAYSGGDAFWPKMPGDAVKICKQIARDIRTQYVVSYSPADQKFCGEYRAIKVRAVSEHGRKLTVRTRAGYTAWPSTASPVECQ